MARNVDFGTIGKYMEALDADLMDIYRQELIELPDGTIAATDPNIPKYVDIPCHISFNQTDNPDPAAIGTEPIIVSLTVNCGIDVDLANKDFIRAKKRSVKGEILNEYEGVVGLPAISQGRQKAIIAARQVVD